MKISFTISVEFTPKQLEAFKEITESNFGEYPLHKKDVVECFKTEALEGIQNHLNVLDMKSNPIVK